MVTTINSMLTSAQADPSKVFKEKAAMKAEVNEQPKVQTVNEIVTEEKKKVPAKKKKKNLK